MRRTQTDEALAGFSDPALDAVWKQAQAAKIARRKTFVARLPLPAGSGVGDVQFWSAAIQQVEQNQWELTQWSVCPEPDGPVAYAVFIPS